MTLDKQELFIHIGFHKTGTSALQETLNDVRQRLLDENIYYPKPLCKYSAQQELSWALFDEVPKWADKEYEKLSVYQHYVNDIKSKGIKTNILSSEDLSMIGDNLEKVEFIREMFADFNCKIVAYVRNPLDFLISLYHHKVRVCETTLDFKSYMKENLNLKVANFSHRLRFWEKIFGNKNVIVRKYDKLKFVSGTLFGDFMSVVGSDFKLESEERRVNVGVHPWVSLTYRQITMDETLDDLTKRKLHKQLIDISQDLPLINSARFYLTEDDLYLIEMVYKEQNKRLEKIYGMQL